jgi:hypothetical protein
MNSKKIIFVCSKDLLSKFLTPKISFFIILIFLIQSITTANAQMVGQPANSYISGQSWFCLDGYRKSGNECISIFADMPGGVKPANSYISGQSWFCLDGYRKSGNECVSIFADMPGKAKPANSYISGQSWFCLDGYRKSGNECVSIFENTNTQVNDAKPQKPPVSSEIELIRAKETIERERQQLAEERRKFDEEKKQREQQRKSQRLNIIVTNTQPTSDGSFTITVNTNSDTASLLINGEEQGGRANGEYTIKKVARAGQETKFSIIATDVNGNIDTKSISVSRQVIESKVIYAALNPNKVKRQPERDSVAVIIGIADYRSLPKADYANDDARAFYDYAIRALGVKPENIKLLVDSDAEEAEILKAFRTWLPSRVKSTTDVYVYYSGHGLPTQDGQGLYLLPPRADREVIDDTAIPFNKVNAALQLAKPRSVTIFMDACYSGQARSGETLVAGVRPISLRSENRLFPDGFTVITASQHDQISSSSPELKHGIFSYYLMRGMEGDADANQDGRITLGEMQAYLAENVGRQAAMMSRKQVPQLIGDVNRVLVGR